MCTNIYVTFDTPLLILFRCLNISQVAIRIHLSQGVQLRCWSDRDSGTIALVLDATASRAGLLAAIHWRLQTPG